MFPLAHADLGTDVTAALARGSWLAFALVFVGGFLTSLTPCVYPMIPITLSIFGARGRAVSRWRALGLAAVYVGGIAVMYAGLGVGSALAGRAFGTFLASPCLVVPIAALFVAMAASMLGAFGINLPSSLQTRLARIGGAGWKGAFVMGLVGGIIAAPCTGPVLASVLAYVATTRSVVFGGSLLFTYALGMGVLFFVLAAGAARLPRSGRWMEAVKDVFAIVMLLAALYFLRSVVPSLGRYGDWRGRFALRQGVVVLVGILVGGIHLRFHSHWRHRTQKALGIALIVVGGFGVIGWLLAPRPLAWIPSESAARTRALSEHKPMLLDFSANWCIPCKELDVKTFSHPAVAEELARRWIAVRIDCSEEDDASSAARKTYGAATLPTVVLVDSGGRVVTRWNRFVSADELLPSLRSVK